MARATMAKQKKTRGKVLIQIPRSAFEVNVPQLALDAGSAAKTVVFQGVGDVNQDGFIGGDDVGPVDNDNLAGLTAFDSGYMTNDINGDGFVGGDDVSITDNNNLLGVFYLYP